MPHMQEGIDALTAFVLGIRAGVANPLLFAWFHAVLLLIKVWASYTCLLHLSLKRYYRIREKDGG